MAAKHNRMIKRAAKKHGIPAKWLYGLWGAEHGLKESGFQRSSAGAQGPFQFMPATARSYGINPYKFGQAADAAAKYLAAYKGRGLEGMYRAYNAGPAGSDNPESRGHYAAARRYMQQWPGAELDKKGARRKAMEIRLGGIPDRKVKQYGTKDVPTFDEKGYEQAQRRQLVAQMLAKRNPDSVLFKSGLLSTEAPDPSQFMDTRQEITERTEVMKGIKGQKIKVPGGKGGKVRGGGGWGGSKGIAYGATEGMPRGSQKRTTQNTASGGVSDHWTGAKSSYAIDVPARGAQGAEFARRMAKRLGIKDYSTGNFGSYVVHGAGGKRYRVQILWNVADHYDHVHIGVKAA
jgi:hypothetical protein